MKRADILVIGAGPAGIAASVRAASGGRQVTLLDDNIAEGGQIWRGGRNRPVNSSAAEWFRLLQASGAEVLSGARVVHGDVETQTLRGETVEGAFSIGYKRLILATGARELFLPFPGWTLPGVTGVGGIQALVKGGLSVKEKRIVVAGSGPLLLAVAAYLRKRGAIVPAIIEQAGWSRLVGFGIGIASSPGKLAQAVSLKASLGATPYWAGSWVISAEGTERVQGACIQQPSGVKTLDCDYLAVSYGLTPNTELPTLLGCSVEVDEFQRTNRPEILCAGESTGIGGVDLSLVEGEIAGYAATGQEANAQKLFQARRRAQRFAESLNRTFAPRAELRELPDARTLVCRCEDVPFDKLKTADSWRAAKLHFRCGMGPCQGRVCGPAVQFLFGWTPESVRPPLFPARLNTLISDTIPQNQETTTK